MIKTYGRRGACRSACMDFPGASMRLQLHNLKANPNHWHTCRQTSYSPWCHTTAWHFQDTRTSFSKPQQLWRHLEVPLQFRCIVLKPGRQHVSIHGYTVMDQPVARNLFQSLAAGIMLVEPQQSSDNSLCSHPVASKTSQSGITCHKLQKDRSWLQTRSQNLISKMKPFLASPNETIEAASQKLKLKMASVERDTNCPNRKEMPRRQKKDLPMNVPANPSTDARTTEVYVSIKFHSSTSEARDSLHASSCQNQRSYTVFFYIMLALRRYSH